MRATVWLIGVFYVSRSTCQGLKGESHRQGGSLRMDGTMSSQFSVLYSASMFEITVRANPIPPTSLNRAGTRSNPYPIKKKPVPAKLDQHVGTCHPTFNLVISCSFSPCGKWEIFLHNARPCFVKEGDKRNAKATEDLLEATDQG